MISRTYDRLAKPFVSLGERNPFAFAGFPASSRPKTQGSEINDGFGARAADVAPLGDSEMAPQAVGIAQNGLGNGAAGSNRWAGESITPYESSRIQVVLRAPN
jgi:hypothetical protein